MGMALMGVCDGALMGVALVGVCDGALMGVILVGVGGEALMGVTLVGVGDEDDGRGTGGSNAPRPATDGRHSDETARLFHHGIYSSTHLRGLKHQVRRFGAC